MSNLFTDYDGLTAIHPGYYVNEYLEEYNMTQSELSKKSKLTKKYINDLINGQSEIHLPQANKLALVFNTSPDLWINLNKRYLEDIHKIHLRQKEELYVYS